MADFWTASRDSAVVDTYDIHDHAGSVYTLSWVLGIAEYEVEERLVELGLWDGGDRPDLCCICPQSNSTRMNKPAATITRAGRKHSICEKHLDLYLEYMPPTEVGRIR